MPSAQSNRPPLDVLDPENVAYQRFKLHPSILSCSGQNLQGPVSQLDRPRAISMASFNCEKGARARPLNYGAGLAGVRHEGPLRLPNRTHASLPRYVRFVPKADIWRLIPSPRRLEVALNWGP